MRIANNGSVVWSMAQDAFGRAVVSSNSTIICNLRFSSQYYDEEKGSHNNTMRDYEPEDARYTSPDMAEQYPNPYLFARNNPLSVTDPLGLWGSDVHYGMTVEWAAFPKALEGRRCGTCEKRLKETVLILFCHFIANSHSQEANRGQVSTNNK